MIRRIKHPAQRLVLASSSAFRKNLLQRLGLAFESFSPALDETAQTGESGYDLSSRLALAKARAGQTHYGDALIIGSDQVAMLDNQQLHKPGDRQTAMQQLSGASGKQVIFFTALCVLDGTRGQVQQHVDICRVQFRPLSNEEISRYLDREQPFDCAGSIKSEALGISLLEKMETEDPTGLIGLPLMALVGMLKQAGVQIP